MRGGLQREFRDECLAMEWFWNRLERAADSQENPTRLTLQMRRTGAVYCVTCRRVAGRYSGCYVRTTVSGEIFRPYAGERCVPSHLRRMNALTAQAPAAMLIV